MPCYVDPLFDTRGWSENWPYPFACHLMADSDDELHAMAGRLGLQRAWHQTRPPHSISHYDLTVRKRARAVQLGAVEVDARFMPTREREKIVNGHGLERTSPKGGPFLGRCRYCGTENLPMRAALEPCPQAPSQEQQLLDAIEGD